MLSCHHSADNSLPLVSLILAFYISTVFGRWWTMFENISWLEGVANKLVAMAPMNEARVYRRKVMRWVRSLAG